MTQAKYKAAAKWLVKQTHCNCSTGIYTVFRKQNKIGFLTKNNQAE